MPERIVRRTQCLYERDGWMDGWMDGCAVRGTLNAVRGSRYTVGHGLQRAATYMPVL
ncbi:hypothetical protein BS50DRAFT_570581 [Corynespora cassiicola Philippines]|uniref:Uncharacterized protein n=1 Tax=Corynespora cassiicola Philippines TaxID=1448308 RepID=A0A2T2P0G2_CORCC|nr:hypothetical protein BS50DRAFT_570581 [Corynespora cassiicola Philippines]